MRKLGFVVFTFVAAGLGIMAGLEADRYLNPAKAVEAPMAQSVGTSEVRPVSLGSTSALSVDFRDAVKKVVPAVVSVDKRERVRRFFFSDETELVPTGTGSGVIISKDGHVLTNFHVVANAAQLTVRLADGRTVPAEYVGGDRRADLALLKVKLDNLQPAILADSAKLEIGEWVIAVGNPLGYSNTVSVGVVSSLKRSLPTGRDSWLVDSIQTDAAINSGNSGGALANALGEVVGINTAIATNTGGSVGIGFAIPINRAKRVVDDILKFGRVRYGSAGLTPYPDSGVLRDRGARAAITEATGAEPPTEGILVSEIDDSGPAAQAGITRLDVILSIDGVKVLDPSQYSKIFQDKKPGDVIQVRFWSAGREKTARLTLVDLGGS